MEIDTLTGNYYNIISDKYYNKLWNMIQKVGVWQLEKNGKVIPNRGNNEWYKI